MASFGIGGAFDVEADVVVLVVVFLKIVKDARRGTICLVRRGDVCDHVLSEVVGIFVLSIAAKHFVLCLFHRTCLWRVPTHAEECSCLGVWFYPW